MQKNGKEPGFVDAQQEKTQASTLTPKIGAQKNLESDETTTIVFVSDSAFQCFFRIKKRPSYAQVMAKKLTTAPKLHLAEKLQRLS